MISSNVMGYSIISIYALSYGISHLISLPPAPKSVQEFDIQPAIISFLQMVVCSVVFYIYHSKGSLLDTFTQLSSIPTHIYVKLAFLSFAYSGNILVQSFLRDDRYKQSINTIRGGTILMNAIILVLLCGRKYVKIQWIAILIQVSVVLMVRNEDFIILFQNSPIFHILMIVSVFVTAVCASAFDSLTKANFNIPLMTINMIFFGFGFCFNMMAAMISVFISNSTWTTSRIYWFETVCVMVNGIMSTFIYKYFDSVAESLIQQSMGIVLVLISAQLHHTYINMNDIIGHGIILSTVYLYFSDAAAVKVYNRKLPYTTLFEQGDISKTIQLNPKKKSNTSIRISLFLVLVLSMGGFSFLIIRQSYEKVEIVLGDERTIDLLKTNTNGSKTAFCIVGDSNSFILPTVHKSIVDFGSSLSDEIVDYFIDIHDTGDYHCGRWSNLNGNFTIKTAIDMFSPKHISLEKIKQWKDSGFITERINQRLYKSRISCFDGVKSLEKINGWSYDWYAFVKPDLHFFENSQFIVSHLHTSRSYVSSFEDQLLNSDIFIVPSVQVDKFMEANRKSYEYNGTYNLDHQNHGINLAYQSLPMLYAKARCSGVLECSRFRNEIFYNMNYVGWLSPLDYCAMKT